MIARGIVDVILGLDRIAQSVRVAFRPTHKLQHDLDECQRRLGELAWFEPFERRAVLDRQAIIEDELLARGFDPWRKDE
jgi:hypothetical protein